jgi:hypothetical protein
MATDLETLLELARGKTVTPEDRAAQRLSFAYANAVMAETRVTRETIERAAADLEKNPVTIPQPK